LSVQILLPYVALIVPGPGIEGFVFTKMATAPPLSVGFGYGIVLGLGFAFAFGMIVGRFLRSSSLADTLLTFL